MRALVTGCFGFVGPHMVRLLVEEGHEVIATDHPKAKPKPLPKGVKFEPLDLTDSLAVDGFIAKYRPEWEFLVAAIFRYDMPRANITRTNVTIMENTLRATRKYNPGVKHIVSWGSASVYGESYKARIPLTEDAAMQPRVAYEESKMLQNIIVRQYPDLPISEIRPMAIYGPGGNYGALVVIDMMAKNQLPGYPGSASNRISLAHVTDVCRAALFLAQRPDTAGKHYNVGDNTMYTIAELMRYLKKELASFGVRVDLFPVCFPMWLMKFFAWRSEQIARKHNHAPIIQRDFLNYFDKGFDFITSSETIRKLGFKFKYDDSIRDNGFRETLEWQRKEGLI